MLEVARASENKAGWAVPTSKGRVGCAHQIQQESNAVSFEGVVRFNAARFGELAVAEDKIITFPNGILGFPEAKRFIILDYEGDVPFKWLQAVDDPALAFLVALPTVIKPDYSLCLKKTELADLGEGEEGDMAIFAILSIPEGNPGGMTANLRGPLVINAATMKGKQIILQDDRYQIKHPVFS